MAVTNDRKYTFDQVHKLLEGAIHKTLGDIDSKGSNQLARAEKSAKITGIAGDIVEQSLFGYARDSQQGCDIEIDGELVELKSTGVRIPKKDLKKAQGKIGKDYNIYFHAKEGISVTAVTLEPTIQYDFTTSHFWEKAQRILIVFYEYTSYSVVPAIEYGNFPIVGYHLNEFSSIEKAQLQSDWELVRDYLGPYYTKYTNPIERREKLEGFTSVLRPNLLLIELVPGYRKKGKGYQHPRYRLKQTFVNTIVKGYFDGSRKGYVNLKQSFSSFRELENRCHDFTEKYRGKTFPELKEILGISTSITTKDFAAKCILKMFDVECKRLNQITDFIKAGIYAKTITLDSKGRSTEDMKLHSIDFEEWADRDIDFEDSQVYNYFMEHSLLCPIFCESDSKDKTQTTFEGFKRLSFDDEFIQTEVKRMWEDSRKLIHTNRLEWEYVYDKEGNKLRNASGSWKGAPNFPKKKDYPVFFRGGANDSSEDSRTVVVNNIKMVPQFYWIKGEYIADRLKSLSFL